MRAYASRLWSFITRTVPSSLSTASRTKLDPQFHDLKRHLPVTLRGKPWQEQRHLLSALPLSVRAATPTWRGRNPLDRRSLPLPPMPSKVQGANRLKGVPVERCRGVSSQLRAAE